MLQVNSRAVEPSTPDADAHIAETHFDLSAWVGLVRRQWITIAGVFALVMLVALVYLFTAQARYTATAELIIDSRKVQLFQQQSVLGDVPLDSAAVESQVEVLKSENIAQSVIKDLKLTEDPEFTGGSSGLLGAAISAVAGIFDSGAAPSEYEQLRRAIETFEKRLAIKRIGLSYVIEISFTSQDSQKAAQIANAVADAYVLDALEAKYQATRRASMWLQDRIRELRDQAQVADRAVQDFKAKHNIVDTGARLLNEQQLAEVSSQLMMARAQTAEAKAKLDRIAEISKDPITDAAVKDVLVNDVITRLRQQYLDDARRENDWSTRYGHDHPAAVNIRNEMKEIQKNITNELRRIAQTYQSDYDIAKAREDSLQASLDESVRQTTSTNQAQVDLRQLESSAQTYRTLYESFLQRFTEATQQQSFPITESRLITSASQPLKKSHPKTLLVLAAGILAGALAGIGVAFVRERLDRVFRTGTQLENLTGMECLGVLPTVQKRTKGASQGEEPVPAQPGKRLLLRDIGIGRTVVDEPFSRFTETIRGIKVAADMVGLTRETRVIGVVSALPNEGKTTAACNLAQLIAHAGGKVLLVDADLRNPSQSRTLTPNAAIGLVEVIGGKATLSDVLWHDPITGLAFAPAVPKSRIAHTSELLSSRAMQSALDDARKEYDYVILDLPPILPVIDAKAITHMLDAFLLVVEWGSTSQEVVIEALASTPGARDKLLGAVLNKANPAVLKRLEAYKGKYYTGYYARYGYGRS